MVIIYILILETSYCEPLIYLFHSFIKPLKHNMVFSVVFKYLGKNCFFEFLYPLRKRYTQNSSKLRVTEALGDKYRYMWVFGKTENDGMYKIEQKKLYTCWQTFWKILLFPYQYALSMKS